MKINEADANLACKANYAAWTTLVIWAISVALLLGIITYQVPPVIWFYFALINSFIIFWISVGILYRYEVAIGTCSLIKEKRINYYIEFGLYMIPLIGLISYIGHLFSDQNDDNTNLKKVLPASTILTILPVLTGNILPVLIYML